MIDNGYLELAITGQHAVDERVGGAEDGDRRNEDGEGADEWGSWDG